MNPVTSSNHTQATHVTPVAVYLAVAATLLILTAVTVAASFADFGPWNTVVALAIAGAKMTLVALVFMHLYRDNKLYFFIFVAAILFLVVFIIFTMFDTMRRGEIHGESAQAINSAGARPDFLPDSAGQADSVGSVDRTTTGDHGEEPTR
jgi:caa(3)-type oxidase subunit IV